MYGILRSENKMDSKQYIIMDWMSLSWFRFVLEYLVMDCEIICYLFVDNGEHLPMVFQETLKQLLIWENKFIFFLKGWEGCSVLE